MRSRGIQSRILGAALLICFWAFFSPTLRSAESNASPAVILQTAKKHLQANRDAEAEALLKDLLRSDTQATTATEARFLIGHAQAKQKRVDEALRTFSGIATSYPGTNWAAMALEQSIELYEIRRNPTSAQKIREELLKRYPGNAATARTWLATADRLFAEEKFSAAYAIYQPMASQLPPAAAFRLAVAKAITETHGDPAKLLPLANRALDQNNPHLARALYERLLKSTKMVPDFPQIETKLAWCIYLQGGEENLRRAERMWRGVISRTKPVDPWYAESRWHLVQLAAGPEGNWSKAVTLCQEIAKEQAPGTFAQEQALFARAWLLTMHKQWKPALAAFEELAKAYPDKLLHPPVMRYRELALQGAQTGKGMP